VFFAASLTLSIFAGRVSALAADSEDCVPNLYDALLGTMKEPAYSGRADATPE
jgi:hypothetical protein